jgi:hypothetical protein
MWQLHLIWYNSFVQAIGFVMISMAENRNCPADSGGGLLYWISAKSVEWFIWYMKISFVALCKLNIIMDHYGWKMELPDSECMYVCKGWAIKPAPAPRPSAMYCATPTANPLLILHSGWNVGP